VVLLDSHAGPGEARCRIQFRLQIAGGGVYYFQQLEEELGRAVSFLIDPTGGGRAVDIVVAEQSFKQLVHLGYSLLPLFKVKEPEKALAEWRSVLTAALKAEELRNTILHSTFGTSIDDEPTFQRNKVTAKFKRGWKEAVETLDEETVEKYRVEIGTVASKISTFMSRTFPRWHMRQWVPES
jgi:hypothetical protein